MQLKAQHVFRTLEPYRVIADLKLSIEEKEGLFFTPYPHRPEHLFQIESNELIGFGYNSPTPACNVFDFLAIHFGSYEKAMDYVVDHYYNLALIPTGVTLESIQMHMVESLKEDRRQFEEILKLREGLRLRSEKLTSAYIYCRRLGLSPEHAWRMIYVTSGKQLNHLLHYVTGSSETFNDAHTYIIFPYFKNRHTFAMLRVHDSSGKFYKQVDLTPSRYMLFGLHSCFPDSKQTRVFDSDEEALVMHSHAMQSGDFTVGFLTLAFDPNAEATDPLYRSGVLMAAKGTDFNTIVRTRMAFDKFFVAPAERKYADTIEPLPWMRYAINQVVATFREDGEYSPRISGMVESIKGDTETYATLIAYLESVNQKEFLASIRKHIDARQVFNVGGLQIFETPTGYLAKKPGTNVTSHFTNFIIKLDCSIWFEDSEQMYYSGRVLINKHPIPFLISCDDLASARLILSQAQRSVNHAGINNDFNLPMVTDTTLSNKLISILAQQTGNKPRRIGVQRLGWNQTKTRFITPSWEAKALGIRSTSKIIHPESKVISNFFTTRSYQLVNDFKLATPQSRYLIALVVASFTRAFLNRQTPIINIICSAQSMALLQAVFRPLGQIAPVELNQNRRLVMDTLSAKNFSGYPIYATCPDLSALDNFNYPVFLLGEAGAPLHESLSPESVLHITSLSYRILSSLTMNFLRERTEAHGLIEVDEAPAIKELALEGKRIIEERCGIKNFDLFEPDLPILQNVLSQITPDKLSDHFRYDFPTQLIVVRCRTISQFTSQKPLFDELFAKNPKVVKHNAHYIECPADWMLDMISKFYGRRIKFYHQPADPLVTEAPDDSLQAGIE